MNRIHSHFCAVAVLFGAVFVFAPSVKAQYEISLAGYQALAGSQISVRFELANVEGTGDFNSFEFKVVTEEPTVEFVGLDKDGTLSATPNWLVGASTTSNTVGGFASSLDAISTSGTLVKLLFNLGAISGTEVLQITGIKFQLGQEPPRTYTPALPEAEFTQGANVAPIASDITVIVTEDITKNFDLPAQDGNGDPMNPTVVVDPQHGDLSVVGLAAEFVPHTDFNGTDSFQYFVSDGQENSNTATVTLMINPSNDPPSAPSLESPLPGTNIQVAGDPANTIPFSWTASNDIDGDDISYTWTASSDASMNPVLWSVTTQDQSVTRTIQEAVDLLDQASVPLGGQITLYHQVSATDGLVNAISPVESFTLERGAVTGTDAVDGLPTSFRVESVYPNPLTNTATLRFGVPVHTFVSVSLFDGLGRNLKTVEAATFSPGFHELMLDLGRLSPGIYHVRLFAGDQSASHQVLKLK